MKRKVIESFQYAADGRHPRLMRAGRSYEFPDDLAARFEADGYLETLKHEKIVIPVVGRHEAIEFRGAPKAPARKPPAKRK